MMVGGDGDQTRSRKRRTELNGGRGLPVFNRLRARREVGAADDVQGLNDEAMLALLAARLRSKAA